jgi:hypothetical protein
MALGFCGIVAPHVARTDTAAASLTHLDATAILESGLALNEWMPGVRV